MITAIRQKLADALVGAPWPAHLYPPDDVAELPCYVIQRPSLSYDVQFATATTFVDVIGRRLNDDEAQQELDDAADAARQALIGPEVAVTACDPIVAVFTGTQTRPAYRLTTLIANIEC